jgi:hypothetical protein
VDDISDSELEDDDVEIDEDGSENKGIPTT